MTIEHTDGDGVDDELVPEGRMIVAQDAILGRRAIYLLLPFSSLHFLSLQTSGRDREGA